MDWLRDIAEQGIRYNDVLCAGLVFHLNRFLERDEARDTYLYLPSQRAEVYAWHPDIEEQYAAKRNLPLLRKSIVDESLPLEADLLNQGSRIFMGGRRGDAILLGLLRYEPSLPELAEAFQHDLDENMRHNCARAISHFGVTARGYAKTLAKRLLEDKSYYAKKAAAEALEHLDNSDVVPLLREAVIQLEETTALFWNMGYFHSDVDKRETCDYCSLAFQSALVSLFKLDPKQGREEFARVSQSSNLLVLHHAKNAFSLAGAGDRIIFPDSYLEERKIIEVPFSAQYNPRELEF